MMTPIEIMSKAAWEAPGGSTWEYCDPEKKDVVRLGMHAALIALAEADLPEGVTEYGGKAIVRNGQYGGSTDESDAETAFRAMLSEIAKG